MISVSGGTIRADSMMAGSTNVLETTKAHANEKPTTTDLPTLEILAGSSLSVTTHNRVPYPMLPR